jgi:GDSL-like lipase/acylhydrolase family protein
MRFVLVLFLASGLLLSAQTPPTNPAFAPVKDDPALPRVLLIGDSISIGYTIPVRKLLAGKVNLHRIPENGGPTIKGLEKIDAWLGDSHWDLIHFNWGLHDLKIMEGSHQVPLVEYEKNMEKLVSRLEKTGAKLIWANTTPVPGPVEKMNPPRNTSDVPAFNGAAARIMAAHGIPTDDLYGLALQRLDKIQRPHNVHFTDAGSAELGEAVAAAIEKALR